MNNHISSRTSSFSAPVVQSRLEHHHQQQMLKQPEIRNHHQPQRSKSLNNKGKRVVSYNNHQKIKETNNINSLLPPPPSSSSTKTNTYSRVIGNKNFSNNFDSSYHHRDHNVGCNNNNNNSNTSLFSVGQLQRKSSTSNKPQRRHQYSDSIDEDKFRVKNISILKRPQSATDFVKSSSSPSSKSSSSSLDVTREEQSNHHRSNKVSEKSTQRSQSKERRRSDVTPRSKRSQRKEIKSMELEADLMLNVTTSTAIQQLSVSSDESDVNSNKSVMSSFHYNNTTTATTKKSTNAVIFPPLNYSNAIIALEEGMNSNKKEDTYSAISDDNITVKSNKKRSDRYVETTPRRLSGTAIELQSQVSRFSDSDSESSLSSLRRLGVAKLYAGPTFHNSPAPSDLPMPSFYSKSLGKEPSPLSTIGNNLFTVPELSSPPSLVHPSHDSYSSPSSGNTSDDDMFSMDDVEPVSTSRQYQTAAAYMVPERMATAHNPMQVYPTNDLNEISETLRSLLKIHGQ